MSIRRYLVLILLSIITLVIFVSAIQGYKTSMSKAQNLFDKELISLTQVLTAVALPSGVIDQQDQPNFAYQLIVDNQVFSRSSNTPSTMINELSVGFRETNFLGKRWRTYTEKLKNTANENKWFIIAQPIKKRFDLAEEHYSISCYTDYCCYATIGINHIACC